MALAIVDEPVPVQVQHLLTSSERLRPSQTLTIAARRLPSAPAHAALFVLSGPSYRAQRLVQMSFGVAVGQVTLPASMAPGTWAIGVKDVSQLKGSAQHQAAGTAILDLGIFTVMRGNRS